MCLIDLEGQADQEVETEDLGSGPRILTVRYLTGKSRMTGYSGAVELLGAGCQPSRSASAGRGSGSTPGGQPAVDRAVTSTGSAATYALVSAVVVSVVIPEGDRRES
jgi:hypothetical protein